MPEQSRKSSIQDRKRDAARAGLNLSDERVAELMGRYDDLEAYFETWPTKDNCGTLKHSDGIDHYYYVEDGK